MIRLAFFQPSCLPFDLGRNLGGEKSSSRTLYALLGVCYCLCLLLGDFFHSFMQALLSKAGVLVSSHGRVAHGFKCSSSANRDKDSIDQGKERLIHYTRIGAHLVMKLSRYVLESNPKLVYRQHPRSSKPTS